MDAFLIKGHGLLKKHNYVSNKVSNSIKKEFDSKFICVKKFLKTITTFYNDEALGFHK